MLDSTIGSESVGCSINSFHFYGEIAKGKSSKLPKCPKTKNPIWLTEIATNITPDNWGPIDVQTLRDRLRLTAVSGYSTVLLWSALRNGDSQTKFYTQGSIDTELSQLLKKRG